MPKKFSIFVGHIRAHTALPRPLWRGNRLAHVYTCPYALAIKESNVDKAMQVHTKFHLNAGSLRFHCKIIKGQVLETCPMCAEFISAPNLGVIPRGLNPNDIWQMDLTHVPSFGNL